MDQAKAVRALESHVKKFDGTGEKTLQQWLNATTATMTRLGISRQVGARILPIFLSGQVLHKFETIADHDTLPWDDLVRELLSANKSTLRMQTAKAELSEMTQGRQTPADFAEKIRGKAAYAYQGELRAEAIEKISIDIFVKGLKPTVRKAIRRLRTPPTTLDEAVAEAEREQVLQEQEDESETVNVVHKIEELTEEVRKIGFNPNQEPYRRPEYQHGYRGRPPMRQFSNRRDGPFQSPNRRDVRFQSPNRREGPFQNPNRRFQNWWNRPFGNNQRGNRDYPNRFSRSRYEGPRWKEDEPQPEAERPRQWNQPPANRGFRSRINNLTSIFLIVTLIACSEQKPQICGYTQGGQFFSPPRPIYCPTTQNIIRTDSVDLYAINDSPLRVPAYKCFKDTAVGNVHSMLMIRLQYTFQYQERNALSIEDCQEAYASKKYKGTDLTEVIPGVFRSEEINDSNNTTPLWGQATVIKFVLTIETGEVATLNGESVTTLLGAAPNCHFRTGQCTTAKYTLIWSRSEGAPWCKYRYQGRYDAIIHLDSDYKVTLAIPELHRYLEVSSDLAAATRETAHCDGPNPYITEDGFMIRFTNLPPHAYLSDYLIETAYKRRRREVIQIGDNHDHILTYDIGEPIQQKLIERLFNVTRPEQTPNFHTTPVSDPIVLNELRRLNISQQLLTARARNYPADYNNKILVVLKAIRYEEYRIRELAKLRTKRMLTGGEQHYLESMEASIHDLFDTHLDAEFGPSTPGEVKPRIQDIPTYARLPSQDLPPTPAPSPTTPPPRIMPRPTPIFTTIQTPPPTNRPSPTIPLYQTAPIFTTIQAPPPTNRPIPAIPQYHATTVTPPPTPNPTPYPNPTTKPYYNSQSTPRPTTTITPYPTPTISTPTTIPIPLPTTTQPPSHRFNHHPNPFNPVHSLTTRPTTTKTPQTQPPPLVQMAQSLHLWPKPKKQPEPTTTLTPLFDDQLYSLQQETRAEPMAQISPFQLLQETCEAQLEKSQLAHTLIRLDPTAGTRLLLRRDDISAKFAGDALLISQCRAVEVTNIHWNQRVAGKCFDLIPVNVSGTYWFMVHGSHDLVETASEVPCHDMTPAAHRKEGTWTSEYGTVDVQNIESPGGASSKPFIFQPPTMFYNNIGAGEPYAPLYPGRIRKLEEAQRRMSRELEKEGVLATTWEHFKSVPGNITTSLSKMYGKATDALTNKLEEVKWNLIALALWITVPILIVILFIGICVCTIKLWFLKRAASATGNALLKIATQSPTVIRRLKQTANVHNVRFEEEEPVTIGPKEDWKIPEIYATFAQRHSSLPHITVWVNGRAVNALVDTGASLSYMRRNTAEHTHIDVQKDAASARVANGTKLQFIGSACPTVSIASVEIPIPMKVSENGDCPAAILLGIDFIQALNNLGLDVAFNLNHHSIRIGKATVQLNAIPEEDTGEKVIIKETVTIEPRTEMSIPASIKGFYQHGTYLIEDNKRDSANIYAIARSLVEPTTDGTCLIQVMNPTATRIRLYKNTYVADASFIPDDEDHIHHINLPAEHIPPEAHWEARLPRLPQKVPPNFDIANEVDLSKANLSQTQKEQLREIIRKHHKAFVGPDGRLGKYNGPLRHKIDLKANVNIPSAKVYRIPLEKRAEVENQIRLMLEDGIIRKSRSPFMAPIVLVRKADKQSWRFTIDYRALNAITRPQSSILPNITDIVDLCAQQNYYSSFDFQSGFHQIPVEESHCERTAFACHLGSFEYVTMPMGLMGAPATFQGIMNELKYTLNARAFIYIDDLVVTSSTAEEHIRDIEEVLGKIESIGLKLKPSKTRLAQNTIKFLGFILSTEGIRPDPEKVRAISEYPTPKNVRDVRMFIGMSSFYRRFIGQFSSITAPLSALTRKEAEFNWTPECAEAFEQIKAALVREPILVAPRLGSPFVIETDSSGKGVAAVLKQAHPDDPTDLRVIAYASRTLNGPESRYPAIELEALGVVFATKAFRPYIDGAKTTIVTDHSPLKALLTRKDLCGRLAKYQIILQEYDIVITYRPGKANGVCDALSRQLPKTDEPQVTFVALKEYDEITPKQIREEQESSDHLKQVREELTTNPEHEFSEKYLVINDIVYKLPEGQKLNPIIALRKHSKYGKQLANSIHYSSFGAAHLGVDKTVAKVKLFAEWPGMHEDIRKIVGTCEPCQKKKDPIQYRATEPLHPFETPERPMQRVHCDFVGPFPQSFNGNRHLLVMTCAFTKFTIAEPVPNQTADTTARTIVNRLIARFGIPETLISDCGTNFTSEVFRTVMKLLGCEHATSSPYHHQANGQVERVNRTIEELIRQVVDKDQANWDERVHVLLHTLNNSKHAVTKISPFMAMHGREAPSPFTIALQTPLKRYRDVADYTDELQQTLRWLHQNIQKRLEETAEKEKEQYDRKKKAQTRKIAVGDKVLIKEETGNKLTDKYAGPSEVIEVKDPNVTVRNIKKKNRGAPIVIHKNRCKPFITSSTWKGRLRPRRK